MAAKKVMVEIKLQISGGQATPAPPVGPALGQHGLNIMDFCKNFNEKTKDKQGVIVPVVISVYENKTYSFIMKTPPASYLIKKSVNIEKGSSEPQLNKVAKISRSQLEEIARTKMPDLNANDIEAAVKIIAGTARSMGVEVSM